MKDQRFESIGVKIEDLDKLEESKNNNNLNIEVINSNETLDEETLIKLSLKAGFIRKVYGILSVQLLITFGSVLLCRNKNINDIIIHNKILSIITAILAFFIFIKYLIIIYFYEEISKKVPYNYYLLFVLTFCISIICSLISSYYSYKVVISAIILTLITTIVITLYSFFITKTEFNIFLVGLYVLLCQLSFLCFIFYLFKFKISKAFLIFRLTFTAAIILLFHTNIIFDELDDKKNGLSLDDYIFAALMLYIDIVRIFLFFLCKGKRNSKNNK